MTENWLIQDINKLMQNRNKVVILDTFRQCNFVLPVLAQNHITVLQTDVSITQHWQQVMEELMLRYEAETTFKDQPVVFYITRKLEKLSFLFDYCFTHGCLDLSNPQAWLKNKIFSHTGLQVHIDNPKLLTIAKQGIGKDLQWWKKIVHNLEDVIDLEIELLPFLNSPEKYLKEKDDDIRLLFEEKIHELLDQQYITKPAKTLAEEVVKKMLDGLVNNEISATLLQLYYQWADSTTYRPSLETYIRNYKLIGTLNPWSPHNDHCFQKLDLIALQQIAENCRDKVYVDGKLSLLKKRIFSGKQKLFAPTWWQDIWVLFNANTNSLSSCKDLNTFIEYYTGSFSLVDRSIRNLYEAFLNEVKIIRPLQEYYEGLNHLVLQTWFNFYPQYKSDQQGYLPNLILGVKTKTAIIVGDGVRYEIGNYIATELEKHFKVDKQVMLADMPSETEHNMSALYVGNNEVLNVQSEREGRLVEATGRDIGFFQLENVHYGLSTDIIVLTYKDIDSAGEKLQQAAIKLFTEFESVLIDKISMLLNMGYQDVYLITDHGFVLTGILNEADKIDPNATGIKEVHERFIRTVDIQANNQWLAFKKPYENYNYVYAAMNHRPFKTKGVYGFSHGGFTPQEIIIPKFKFSKHKAASSHLNVLIDNKNELKEVTGELFVIKLQAAKDATDLFTAERKVQVKIYAGKNEFQSSGVVNMDAGKIESLEFTFNKNAQVQAVLLDAITQEQLDTVIIKKSNLRDMGGL